MVDWWNKYLQLNITAKLTMIASVAMSWRCAEWFMNLEPNNCTVGVRICYNGCHDRCVWYILGSRSEG